MVRESTGPEAASDGLERVDVPWEDHLRARHDERRPGLYPMQIRPFLGTALADGRFVTDGYIGRGAFGCVFRGRQTSLHGRPVAVKLLIPPARGDGDSELMQQFERSAYYFDREAAILARLNHPCIVQVLDNGILSDFHGADPLPGPPSAGGRGRVEGVVWIAMELVEGRNLSDLLYDPNEVWTWPRILELSRGVLAGLQAAHVNQVIHRDLKPPNIMVTTPVGMPEMVKLLDFGVAKLFRLLHDRRSQTVIGTPEYMAPEQWTGQLIDHRTDLYAFGVILFQLVSGGLPFNGADVRELSDQHLRAKVPAPQPRVGLVRIAAVDELIRRALAKRPEDRFPDALTMLEALQSAVRAGLPDPEQLLPDLAAAPLTGARTASRGAAPGPPRPERPREDRTCFGPPAPEADAGPRLDATAFLADVGSVLSRDTIVDLQRWFAPESGTGARPPRR
jgi:serine/threonine-protein kinase